MSNHSTDVLVVGGGTAGCIAAISAARCGARVLLCEKNSMLGGTVTRGGVLFPGLFHAWGKQIIGGPGYEAILRAGAKIPPICQNPPHHYDLQIPLNRFDYLSALWEMLTEDGVTVLTEVMPSFASETEQGVTVQLCAKEGQIIVECAVAIDCTGDGNLLSLLGYPLQRSTSPQPATAQNELSGYAREGDYERAISAAFPRASLPAHITQWHLCHWLRIGKIDVHIPAPAAETSWGRTQITREAYALLSAILRFYRGIQGLEHIAISFIAEEVGIRESCRALGEVVVSAEDYISGADYSDTVCHAFYPIDRHVMDGILQQFHAPGVYAHLPLRALIPKNARRVLTAGRLVSADEDASSALRVQATCMASGCAAGVAAAQSAMNGNPVSLLDISALRARIRRIGGIL